MFCRLCRFCVASTSFCAVQVSMQVAAASVFWSFTKLGRGFVRSLRALRGHCTGGELDIVGGKPVPHILLGKSISPPRGYVIFHSSYKNSRAALFLYGNPKSPDEISGHEPPPRQACFFCNLLWEIVGRVSLKKYKRLVKSNSISLWILTYDITPRDWFMYLSYRPDFIRFWLVFLPGVGGVWGPALSDGRADKTERTDRRGTGGEGSGRGEAPPPKM